MPTEISSGTLNLIIVVVNIVVAAFVLPVLRNWAKKCRNQAKVEAEDVKLSIIERLEAFVLDAAANMLETRLPGLLKKLKDGELKTTEQIKDELKVWGNDVKEQAIDAFYQQGTDILKVVGDETLNVMIARAAARVSPFKGNETAVELLKPENQEMLSKFGPCFVRAANEGRLDQVRTSRG